MTHPLLEAMREALAGCQKQAAGEVWPEAADYESRMSKVLSGGLNIPPDLICRALKAPGGHHLLHYFQQEARSDPAEMRELAVELLRESREMNKAALALLQGADESARHQPVKIEPGQARRRIAG